MVLYQVSQKIESNQNLDGYIEKLKYGELSRLRISCFKGRKIIHTTNHNNYSPEVILSDLQDVLTMASTAEHSTYQYFGTSIASTYRIRSEIMICIWQHPNKTLQPIFYL